MFAPSTLPTRSLFYDGGCSTTGELYISVYNLKQTLAVSVLVDGGRTPGPE